MRYKVLEYDGMGYFNLHTKDLNKQEAIDLLNRLRKTFPQHCYIIEEYKHKPKRYVKYNTNAVDGWEDIYKH
jgi:hypothetical protein